MIVKQIDSDDVPAKSELVDELSGGGATLSQ